MKPSADNRDTLYTVISSELKILGVKVPKVKKLKSSASKQEKSSTTSRCKVFGVSLMEQEWISEDGCYLPKFLVIAAKYLEIYCANEGLFRKAGSLLRQKELRMKIENGESWDDAQPNDVASLLKQWLRELPEPLIPSYLQDVFARCLHLNSEHIKVQSVLLSCLLLPSENLNTLAHLLHFLSGLVSHSHKNKMDAHNLAIIMTPNLLHTVPEHTDKANSIVHHTDLLELLITNADKVGQVPCVVAEQMQEKDSKLSEIELSVEILDGSTSVLKKRRKSGPVHDFVHEIRKLVTQNITPVSSAKDQHLNEIKRSHKSVVYCASKRKADIECSSSSAKKRAVTGVRSREIIQTSESTPVGKTSCSINPSASSRKTIFSPLQISGSRNKSGLLKHKGRKREKSVPKSYHIGMKWFSAQNLDESHNLSSSFTPCVKLDEKQMPHPPDHKNVVHIAPPLESSTPLNTSIIYFPTLGATGSSPSVFSPVPNHIIPKPESLVEERENIFPSIRKHSLRSKAISTSASSAENFEDLQNIKMSPLVKRENTCRNVPVFSPLKVQNSAVAEKKVTRNSRKHRSLKNKTSGGLTDLKLCDVALEPNADAKGSRKPSTQTRRTDKNETVPASQSVVSLKDSTTYKQVLAGASVSNPIKRLDRRASRSCTNISEMKTENSNEILCEEGISKKGSTNKSSLRRGRPNTIKTGLPSEFCQRYLTESNAASKQNNICSSSILDLKNSSLLMCSQIHANDSKSYTPKNIRT